MTTITRDQTLDVGTRKSALALWQTHHVVDKLKELDGGKGYGHKYVLQTQEALGDINTSVHLKELGGNSFTKELEVFLLDKKIRFAVHSLKDMPSSLPRGLHLSCISGFEKSPGGED